MKKERILGLDLARAICALLIVLYHYIIQIAGAPEAFQKPDLSTMLPTGNWSITVVSMFFAISAIAMIYTHPRLGLSDLKSFYYKRWKGIIPIYLVVWLPRFFENVALHRSLSYGGHPWKLILTFLGIDGYFLRYSPNYYEIGEWFLGVMILLYAIYPILLWFYRKHFFIGTAIIIGLYVANRMIIGAFNLTNLNFAFCLLQFWMGAMYLRFRRVLKPHLVAFFIFLALAIVVLFVPILYDGMLMPAIGGSLLVILFDYIGDWVMKWNPLNVVATEISSISFEIFLVHHYLIIRFVDQASSIDGAPIIGAAGQVLLFIAVLITTLIKAKAFNLFKKWLLKSKLFLALDHFILK